MRPDRQHSPPVFPVSSSLTPVRRKPGQSRATGRYAARTSGFGQHRVQELLLRPAHFHRLVAGGVPGRGRVVQPAFARPGGLADHDRRHDHHGAGDRRCDFAPGPRPADRRAHRQRPHSPTASAGRSEIPFEAGEAFDLLDAAIRELPRIAAGRERTRQPAGARQGQRTEPYGEQPLGRCNPLLWFGIAAQPDPGHGHARRRHRQRHPDLRAGKPARGATGSCVDDGTNLENAEAITRAITRRVAERRRGEQAAAAQTATEKELTVAKLSLLHAQVEPHFLYNTLASAQYLTRSDPARADEMLGHLIPTCAIRCRAPRTRCRRWARNSNARAPTWRSCKIRMGPRLAVQIDVPEHLRATPLPPMMLQTLVENAIKHGLEPRTGGGTVWILRAPQRRRAWRSPWPTTARASATKTSGTGIGLKNVRERLRLAYGAQASLRDRRQLPHRRRRDDHRARRLRRRSAAMAEPVLLPASSPKTKRCCARRWSTSSRRGLAGAGDRRRMRGRRQRAGSDRRAAARRRLPRHPHAGPDRPGGRRRRGRSQPAHADRVRHRLRPVRDRRLRTRRGRLPAQADRTPSAWPPPCSACRRARHRRAAKRPRWPRCCERLASALPRTDAPPPLAWLTASAGTRDAPDPGRRRRLLPRRQQVHDGDDRRGRGAAAQADPRPARRARPDHVQADPPLDHRQPQGDRVDRPRRHRRGHRAAQVAARNADRQPPFMALFRHM